MSRPAKINPGDGDFYSADRCAQPLEGISSDRLRRTSQCLVMSTGRLQRERISLAATRGGWDTVVCADPPNALAAARRYRFQLAWVDLAHGGAAPAGFRELCQMLADPPGLLLAICGNEDNAEEEIWARQLGVWLYVPGLSNAPVDELSVLCEQAYQLAAMPLPAR